MGRPPTTVNRLCFDVCFDIRFIVCFLTLAMVMAPTAAQAFNPACDQTNKAVAFELYNADSLLSHKGDPVPITVPVPYLPIPAQHYKTETVNLILRAVWPSLKPACLDIENFSIGPSNDPAAIMMGHFDRIITLQIAGSTSLSLEAAKRAQLRLNPFDRGLSADGGLKIYGASPLPPPDQSESLEPNPPAPTAPIMPPALGGFPAFEHGELLIPVDENATPLAWILCVKLPIPQAPEQCQARLRVNRDVQAEVTFNRKLLADWQQAMQATASLIERFIDVADSQPL